MRVAIFVYIIFLSSCGIQNQTASNKAPFKENTTHLQQKDLAPFYHGVASGDPYQNSVVIWTRVTPQVQMDKISVEWQVAEDAEFTNLVQSGMHATSLEKDYTVKVIVNGLKPGTDYFYRFKSMKRYSSTGRTKTLPMDDEESIDLAIVSCSNIEFGYFNAYAAIAKDDVDAVIHLGDYIYEYGPDKYGDTSFHRKNIPAHEIISLRDYRDRYSQYRLDDDLQAAHAALPFINIWDDHEITNNAYVSGAENHQDDEGDYKQRKSDARQAFYEWLPIREGKTHYRKFNFGNTLDLIMLDERLAGRTMQADSITDPRRMSDDHHLLGEDQMDWLISALEQSKATWKVIGNQVIFSYSDWGYEGFSLNMDAWDGYPRDQKTLTQAVRQKRLDNIVFVTGDTHTAWAFEATSDPYHNYERNTGKGAIGVEFGVTSITSANANERFPDDFVKKHENKITNSDLNPHLKYVNMRDHGYLRLSVNPDKITAEYKVVGSLKERNAKTKVDKVFEVERGKTKLIEN